MNEYELVYIVTPRRAPAEVEQISEWVAGQVAQGGGEVISSRNWGRRRLAYPINHHLDGTYVLMRLRMPPEGAVTLERNLHIQEDVIRHMLIRGIMGTDEAPPEYVGERPRSALRGAMPAEPRAERAPEQAPAPSASVAVPEAAPEPATAAPAEPPAPEPASEPAAPAAEPAPEAPPEPASAVEAE